LSPFLFGFVLPVTCLFFHCVLFPCCWMEFSLII
jgi:hypothetical protein